MAAQGRWDSAMRSAVATQVPQRGTTEGMLWRAWATRPALIAHGYLWRSIETVPDIHAATRTLDLAQAQSNGERVTLGLTAHDSSINLEP